jgi:hypothetical protein
MILLPLVGSNWLVRLLSMARFDAALRACGLSTEGPVMGLERGAALFGLGHGPTGNGRSPWTRQSRSRQRLNIGSRVTREGHARFWERPEVKFLRATRQPATFRSTARCI